MSENTETTALPDVETDGVEDFDAFWDSPAALTGKTTTIMGETITLPRAIPLQFELEAKRVKRSKRPSDIKRMVAILFGAESLDRWAEKGMDQHQFMVLLAWAPRVIAGQKITLAEVDAEVRSLSARQEMPDPT